MHLHVEVSKKLSSFCLTADFTLAQDRVGIFGPSGSGKSTLVNLIAGLEQPDRGVIRLDGVTLFEGRTSLPPERRRIGIIFQEPHLFPHLDVKGNLLYGQRRCPSASRRVELDTLEEVLQLGGLMDRGVNRLSGGEKRRVAIGRAVLSSPRLLLMDEPLSGLDDNLRFQIIRFLRTACESFSIPYLFISHSLLEMQLMSEQVVVFENGVQKGMTDADSLARNRMGDSPAGYINLLRLGAPSHLDGLWAYSWGGGQLLLSDGVEDSECIAELSSKEIMLFKQHPEAISARNLLECTVRSLFHSGGKVGVEMDCGGETLVAEIVPDAARELGIAAGSVVYAAIKATAFRVLPSGSAGDREA